MMLRMFTAVAEIEVLCNLYSLLRGLNLHVWSGKRERGNVNKTTKCEQE